jgi:hypothetical protein
MGIRRLGRPTGYNYPVGLSAPEIIADFLVIAGDRNLAVWAQESQLDSYMQ